MTKNETLRKAVARIRGEASAARAFFHTWKALQLAREDAGLLATINDSRYIDFFLVSMAGNFRLFFLSLGNILDEDDRSMGISKLQYLLKDSDKDYLAQEINIITKKYQKTIKQIKQIRNKSIAHNDFEETDEIFKSISVTPNEIEAFIDAILATIRTIALDVNGQGSISKGTRNEQAARNILEALRINRMYKIETLEWVDIRGFFKEHGCVIAGRPEIEWYRTAWTALERAGLTCSGKLGSFQVDLTTVKLRALCLMAMYLGAYQATDEFSKILGGYFSEHSSVFWYLESLNVDMEDIWNLAHQNGVLDSENPGYEEDEDVDVEQLCEIATDLAVDERDVIYKALVEHYGGNEGLFVSWWNSRRPLDEGASWPDIFASADPDDGTFEAWEYMEAGMKDFWWG